MKFTDEEIRNQQSKMNENLFKHLLQERFVHSDFALRKKKFLCKTKQTKNAMHDALTFFS